MPFDRYTPCPGGTGKKIKFCCDDLLNELATIDKMLEGEQRLACLEHVEKTLHKYPDRACLLAVKSLLLQELEKDDSLRATLDHFLAKHPNNPVALAEQAIFVAESENGPAGVEPLQQAINAIDEQMPTRVYEALGMVGRILLSEGHILAAQAHLLMQATIGGAEDTRAMSLLGPVYNSPQVPLLLKDDHALAEAPDDASWSKPVGEALDLAHRGRWLAAAEKLEGIKDKAQDAPAVWRNLAVLYGWLANTPKAVEAWHRYASLDVPLDDAVEAEALAQLIDRDAAGTMTDLVALVFDVEDVETLTAQFMADPRTVRLPIDPAQVSREGQPPPQSIFYLIDRGMPETGVDIQRHDIPHVVGQCYLFGRETDRNPRLEFAVYRDAKYDEAVEALKATCGSAISESRDEIKLTEISSMQNALTWNWRLPADTPREHREALVVQQRSDVILNRWPALPNPGLGAAAPQDLAKDPSNRVKLLASILNMESALQPTAEFDFNELRRKLDLPVSAPIDPWSVNVQRLPLVRIGRVDTLKLSDEDLILLYRRAVMMAVGRSAEVLALEVTGRPSLDDKVDKAEAFGVLAEFESDSDKSLEYIDKAREVTVARGESPAIWLLAELELRLVRGEAEDIGRLVNRIRARHMQEPGIGSALIQMLSQYGLITPDGQPVAAPPQQGSTIITPESEASAGEIWTPGDESAPEPGKKSAIWTPDD